MTSKDEDSVMSAPEFDSGSKTKTTAHSYDLNTTTTPVAMRSSFAIGVRILPKCVFCNQCKVHIIGVKTL